MEGSHLGESLIRCTLCATTFLLPSDPSSYMSYDDYHSVDTTDAMKTTLRRLWEQLVSETDYFRNACNYVHLRVLASAWTAFIR